MPNLEIMLCKRLKIYQKKKNFHEKSLKNNTLNFNTLNNLNLKEVEENKFPLVRLLNKLPKSSSLFETVLITVNDYLVYKFLDKKINFQ